MTMGDFVQHLLLFLHRDEENLRLHEMEHWHKLFYQLHKLPPEPGRPPFLDKLFFAWNGPYPSCDDVAEYLRRLHLLGFIVCDSPGYRKYWLPEKTVQSWQREHDRLGAREREFLSKAALMAKRELNPIVVSA